MLMKFSLFLILAAAALVGPTASAQPKTPAPTPGVVPAADIPQSVFVMPSNPKEGRNPFFPYSRMGQVEKIIDKPAQVDPSAFTLNGITSPPKRTAMINGRTFETGEQGEVKLPTGGRVLIKCVEIKDGAATILVGGQLRELKLKFGL